MMIPKLTWEAIENHKAKMIKLRQIDKAIAQTYSDPEKGGLKRFYLEKQKQDIRATFPKPRLVQYD